MIPQIFSVQPIDRDSEIEVDIVGKKVGEKSLS